MSESAAPASSSSSKTKSPLIRTLCLITAIVLGILGIIGFICSFLIAVQWFDWFPKDGFFHTMVDLLNPFVSGVLLILAVLAGWWYIQCGKSE